MSAERMFNIYNQDPPRGVQWKPVIKQNNLTDFNLIVFVIDLCFFLEFLHLLFEWNWNKTKGYERGGW